MAAAPLLPQAANKQRNPREYRGNTEHQSACGRGATALLSVVPTMRPRHPASCRSIVYTLGKDIGQHQHAAAPAGGSSRLYLGLISGHRVVRLKQSRQTPLAPSAGICIGSLLSSREHQLYKCVPELPAPVVLHSVYVCVTITIDISVIKHKCTELHHDVKTNSVTSNKVTKSHLSSFFSIRSPSKGGRTCTGMHVCSGTGDARAN